MKMKKLALFTLLLSLFVHPGYTKSRINQQYKSYSEDANPNYSEKKKVAQILQHMRSKCSSRVSNSLCNFSKSVNESSCYSNSCYSKCLRRCMPSSGCTCCPCFHPSCKFTSCNPFSRCHGYHGFNISDVIAGRVLSQCNNYQCILCQIGNQYYLTSRAHDIHSGDIDYVVYIYLPEYLDLFVSKFQRILGEENVTVNHADFGASEVHIKRSNKYLITFMNKEEVISLCRQSFDLKFITTHSVR